MYYRSGRKEQSDYGGLDPDKDATMGHSRIRKVQKHATKLP